MTRMPNLEDHILEILSQAPCSLDELVSACADTTWGHIFGEVDRLSRAGRVTLQMRGRGVYLLSVTGTPGERKGQDRPLSDHIIHPGGRHEHVSTMGTV